MNNEGLDQFRCKKGHRWAGFPGVSFIAGTDKVYGVFCPHCIGQFFERLFPRAEKVTGGNPFPEDQSPGLRTDTKV